MVVEFSAMMLIAVVHPVCGGIAFYTRRRWGEGEILEPSDAVRLDGSVPVEGDPLVCGFCGMLVHTGELCYADLH